jgi:hypothetical protein
MQIPTLKVKVEYVKEGSPLEIGSKNIWIIVGSNINFIFQSVGSRKFKRSKD